MEVLNETASEEDAFAKIIQTYDRYERPIESAYYSVTGDSATGPEGSKIVEREYTSRGEVSLIRYYDENHDPAAVNGVYGIRTDYNAYGNKELETWIGQDGNPAKNDDGYAGIWYDYDLSDQVNVERGYQYYRDENGKPTAANNGAWGRTEVYYPVTRIHKITYIGENGEPVITTEQYAIYEYEQDENGNTVWIGYFDEAQAQTNCADGYSSVEMKYDSEGRLISERYTDRYNKLANNADGIASWNGYYNDDGELIITSCYDKDLTPVSMQ